MMTNTSVCKYFNQVNFVRVAPNYVPKAPNRQDKQKRCIYVIL